MSDDERRDDDHDDQKSEAQIRMEQEVIKRKNKAEEEWKEYEEMRRSEKEKDEEEIQNLRERRGRRKKEREEEEKRLAESRIVEDQKRRAEDEERQRKKREEELKKREEREKRKKEMEELSKVSNRPNFIINKRMGFLDPTSEEGKSKEEIAKSKEQLEAERKAILEQRIQPLNVQGLGADQLKDKAKELHQQIYRLESDRYDLEQRYDKQNYDMMELAERARQMNKGGTGKGGQKMIQAAPDPLAAKISGIPPKVSMYSEYERVKDHRSFTERRVVFGGPNRTERYVRVQPTQKVVMTEQGARAVETLGEDAAGHGGGHGGEQQEVAAEA